MSCVNRHTDTPTAPFPIPSPPETKALTQHSTRCTRGGHSLVRYMHRGRIGVPISGGGGGARGGLTLSRGSGLRREIVRTQPPVTAQLAQPL